MVPYLLESADDVSQEDLEVLKNSFNISKREGMTINLALVFGFSLICCVYAKGYIKRGMGGLSFSDREQSLLPIFSNIGCVAIVAPG